MKVRVSAKREYPQYVFIQEIKLNIFMYIYIDRLWTDMVLRLSITKKIVQWLVMNLWRRIRRKKKYREGKEKENSIIEFECSSGFYLLPCRGISGVGELWPLPIRWWQQRWSPMRPPPSAPRRQERTMTKGESRGQICLLVGCSVLHIGIRWRNVHNCCKPSCNPLDWGHAELSRGSLPRAMV